MEVRWRAFELQPQLPVEGEDADAFFAAKFGGREQAQGMFAHVTQQAATVGLAFRFDLQRRVANTRLAHRVRTLAAAEGHGDAALDALFSGFFEHGVDVGSPDALAPWLAQRGVPDAAALVARAAAGEGDEVVAADEAQAAAVGVTGVPFFVAGGAVVLSGAHEPALLPRGYAPYSRPSVGTSPG